MTTPPGYNAGQSQIDTEGVVGEPGAAPLGTQRVASDTDTTGTGKGAYGGGPTGLTPDPNVAITHTPDTEGIGTGANGPYVPNVNPLLSGNVRTDMVGWPQTPGVTQAYRAPNTTIGYMSVMERDTTRTDQPTSDGNGATRVDLQTKYTGTLFSANVGAFSPAMGTGTPATPNAPTVAAGPRSATVSWTAVADPSNAEILDYVILGSTGGTTFAPRNATSVVVTNLVPDTNYTFKVAARNVNGIGAFSAASATVQAWNPDEADYAKPGGLAAANTANPIYNPDGTFKAGSGLAGIPGTPAAPTLAAGAAGHLVVTWVAPTSGGELTSYTVTLSTGQSVTGLTPTTLTYNFGGLTTGTATTATVTAVGPLGSHTSAASNSVNVP